MFGIVGYGSGRHHRTFTVNSVVVHRERRDSADTLANANPAHSGTNSIDDARGLIANSRRKTGLLEIPALPKHYFGAIQPNRLHPESHLAGLGLLPRQLFDLQDIGRSSPMKSNYLRHTFSPISP